MARCDYSCLPNGGDIVGMTNEQYKGMLLDLQEVWEEVLELAKEANDTKVVKKVEKQIAKINEKLKF